MASTAPDFRLVPYQRMHGPFVVGWAASAEDLDRWAGLACPVTGHDLDRWHAEAGVQAHVLLDREPVGYGEIWVSEEEGEVELARLLIDPRQRGRGVGARLVQLLLEVSRVYAVSTAWVRVVPQNHAALRCYGSVGFRPATEAQQAEFNRPQPRAYTWLSLALQA